MADNSKYPSQNPTRKAWQGMMNRCYTTTNKDYPSLGGKGITVCKEWHNYETFMSDMGSKPDNSQLARYCDGLGFTKDNTYWMQKVDVRSNRLYGIWKGIRRRCGVIGSLTSRKHMSYANRSISMSPDWEYDFQKFCEDVGTPPSEAHSIDRIDNDKGYYKENVRWASSKEQANNRSDNIVIEMDGQRKTLQEWCEFHDVDREVVGGRWRVLFAATRPKNKPCLQYSIEGELIARYNGVKEAANATDIKQGTIAKCLCGGNSSAGGFLWRYEN